MSTSKSLVLAFIWILLLSFIFILFVYILGGQFIQINSSNNLDDCDKLGVIYKWGSSTPSNSPANSGYAIAFNILTDTASALTSRRLQICIIRGATASSYIRCLEDDVWGSWRNFSCDIPTFYKNYNSITALANGMGALFSAYRLEKAWDSIDLPTGIYTTDGATVTQTGLPSEITDLQSCVFIHFRSSVTLQYMRVMLLAYIPSDSSKVAFYFNSYRSTGWQNWHKLV